MQLISTLALATSAAALVAPAAPKASTALKGATLDDQLKKIPGVSPLKNAPADYGFDPLGFAKVSYPRFGLPEDELLRTQNLRDAELRHGRLAMLAAAAWPIQELVHPSLAKMAGAPALLSRDSDGDACWQYGSLNYCTAKGYAHAEQRSVLPCGSVAHPRGC